MSVPLEIHGKSKKQFVVKMTIPQFQLVTNFTTTVHKLQGQTVDALHITNWSHMSNNWPCVALLYLRTWKGLFSCRKIYKGKDFSVGIELQQVLSDFKQQKVQESDMHQKRHWTDNKKITFNFFCTAHFNNSKKKLILFTWIHSNEWKKIKHTHKMFHHETIQKISEYFLHCVFHAQQKCTTRSSREWHVPKKYWTDNKKKHSLFSMITTPHFSMQCSAVHSKKNHPNEPECHKTEARTKVLCSATHALHAHNKHQLFQSLVDTGLSEVQLISWQCMCLNKLAFLWLASYCALSCLPIVHCVVHCTLPWFGGHTHSICPCIF